MGFVLLIVGGLKAGKGEKMGVKSFFISICFIPLSPWGIFWQKWGNI